MARLRNAVLFHPYHETAEIGLPHDALIIGEKRIVFCRPGVIGQWKKAIAVRWCRSCSELSAHWAIFTP